MTPKCKRCGYADSYEMTCAQAHDAHRNPAVSAPVFGPQKQPASLARLKAEVAQVQRTIAELETP